MPNSAEAEIDTETVYYQHFRLGRGHCTFAAQYTENSFPAVRVAVAFCSPKDQFSRKRGRAIATGRLNKLMHRITYVCSPNPALMKKQVTDFLRRDAFLPGWATRA